MRRYVFSLVALLAACGPRAAAESPAPPLPSAAPSATADKAAPAGSERGVERPDPVVSEALALVSAVRQLPVKAQVPGLRLGRVALRAEVERLLADEAPAEVVAGNTEFLYALDAVRADFDLRKALALLLGAELAGFYDPKLRHMVLAEDLSRQAQDLTLYHELVHALQDQHFNLAGAFDYRPDESDLQGALHALAEGDATSAMIDVFQAAGRNAGSADGSVAPVSEALLRLSSVVMQASPELQGVPGILARSVMAPYVDGLAFVTALRSRGRGFSEVDTAFRTPPASTEQVLHPEKYFAREPVVALPLPSAGGGLGSVSFHDVVGEQGLRLLFEEWAPDAAARHAASDWGGDRFAVYNSGTTRVMLWHLVFDHDAAAERAELLFARGALRSELNAASDSKLRPFVAEAAAKAALRRGGLCQNRPERGPFALVRSGRHIGVALGPYSRGDTAVRKADNCPRALGLATKVAAER